MNSRESWLYHALQDVVQFAVEDVETQSDRLIEAIKHAKGVLAMMRKEGFDGDQIRNVQPEHRHDG